MHVLLLNGPNLNLLGQREPGIYGRDTLATIEMELTREAKADGVELVSFQSNFEGALVERIHQAMGESQGILINAGALTHTSIGILDALSMFHGPKIEIHITNVYARESFRHKSYISPVVTGVIAGLGVNSYLLAIDAVNKFIKD